MHPMNVLYAAMVENQAERNRWMKIKDYADQVSVLTSVAVERFLTPWEEQRVKELVLAMLEELRAERRFGFCAMSDVCVPHSKDRGGHNLPPQPMPLPRPLDTSSLLIDPRMDLAALAPRLHHHPTPPPPAPPHLSQHFHQPLPPIASVAEVPPPRKRGRKPLKRGEQCCMSCKTTNTPEWRKGPDGRNSLCNACGLRWSKASRPAPAAAEEEEEEDSSHEQQRQQQQQLSFESHPSVASIAAMAPTSVTALISPGERFEDESGEHRQQEDEPRTREDIQTEDHHIDDDNNNDEDRTVKKESP